MHSFNELYELLSAAPKAWITIGPRYHGWSVEDVCRSLRDHTGKDVDPASVEEWLRRNDLPVVHQPAEPDPTREFPEVLESQIEAALVDELPSLGLELYVDASGRPGRQYRAGVFGIIDIVARKPNGDFVVMEIKRSGRAYDRVIGQLAGYLHHVREHIAGPAGSNAEGWIVAPHTSPEFDHRLRARAEVAGFRVKWCTWSVRLSDTAPWSAI